MVSGALLDLELYDRQLCPPSIQVCVTACTLAEPRSPGGGVQMLWKQLAVGTVSGCAMVLTLLTQHVQRWSLCSTAEVHT